MEFRPSYLKNKNMPTSAEALGAEKKADSLENPDSRELNAVIKRIHSKDGRLRHFVKIRRIGVGSYPFKIDSSDPNLAEKAQLCETRLMPFLKKLLLKLYELPLYGMFAAEIQWTQLDGWIPSIVKKYKPAELLWSEDPNEIKYCDENDNIQTVLNGDPYNFILATDGEEAGGELRTLIDTQIKKFDAIREWAETVKAARGLMQVILNKNATDEDKVAAKQALESAFRNKAALTDESTKIEHNDLVGTGNPNTKEFVEFCTNTAAIAIIGQANTSELPSANGSYAALEVQRLITVEIRLLDQVLIENLINEQIIKPYWIKNESTTTPCPLSFRITWKKDRDPLERASVVTSAYNAGIPILSSEFYDAFDLTKPDGTPDIITKTTGDSYGF